MGYFSWGWPRKYRIRDEFGGNDSSTNKKHTIDHQEQQEQPQQDTRNDHAKVSAPEHDETRCLVVDPSGKYLLCVGEYGLVVWTATLQRVKLCAYDLAQTTLVRAQEAKIQSQPEPPSQNTPRDEITASVTSTPIQSGRATQTRKHDHLVGGVWSKDASRILVATESGLIVVFDVKCIISQQAQQESSSLGLGFLSTLTGNGGGTTYSGLEPVTQINGRLPTYAEGSTRMQLREVEHLRIGHGAKVQSMCRVGNSALIGLSSGQLVMIRMNSLEIAWRCSIIDVLREKDGLSKLGVSTTLESLRVNPILKQILGLPADPAPSNGAGSEKFIKDIHYPSTPLDGYVVDPVSLGIACLTYSEDLRLIGVILGCGISFILGLAMDSEVPPGTAHGKWLRTKGSASIAIEASRMIAAVGLQSGDVESFYIGVPVGDRCPVLRRYSLSGWYYEPQDVGPACLLQWSPDGSALAVGWSERGLAIWSLSGCRLMWTLPQVGGTLPTSARFGGASSFRGSSNENPMETGVSAMTWSPYGFCLWGTARADRKSARAGMRAANLPAATAASDSGSSVKLSLPSSLPETTKPQSSFLVEFSLMRSGIIENPHQSESTRLSMIGSDRILLLASSFFAADQQQFKQKSASPNQKIVQMPANYGSPATASDSFEWQQLLLPPVFLASCWPPRLLSVSDDGAYVAVAGKIGVATCHVRTQRWRIFGDIALKSSALKCCALAWYGKTLILANEKVTGSSVEYELLFFPRDQVDAASMQARKALPAKPFLLDVRADGYVLAVCHDSLMILFRVGEQYSGSSLMVQEVYQLHLPTRELRRYTDAAIVEKGTGALAAPGGGISVARIFPPLQMTSMPGEDTGPKNTDSFPYNLPVPSKVLILRNTGSLVLLDVKRMVSTPLLRNIEHVWLTQTCEPPFEQVSERPLFWAYGDEGLHVCFHDGLGGSADLIGALGLMSPAMNRAGSGTIPGSGMMDMPVISVERWFDMDPEVYPLGLMPEYGFVLGASQGVSYDMSLAPRSPFFKIKVKRQPVLHTMLRHIMEKGQDKRALEIALKCSQHPQFVDSLEWLLYETVLDYDPERRKGPKHGSGANQSLASMNSNDMLENFSSSSSLVSNSAISNSAVLHPSDTNLFPRVLRLLKYFGEYEDIVVRCARKMDAKHWPLLFSYAGEPAALLEQCFTSNRLYTASCLLVILQDMWGFISSTPHSLRLLEAALNKGEVDLAMELSTFLMKADRAGVLNAKQVRMKEDMSWVGIASKQEHSDRKISTPQRWEFRSQVVDAQIVQFFRSALYDVKLRAIVAVSAKFEFPLAEFLRRESLLVARALMDPGDVLLKLHRQFELLEPSPQEMSNAWAFARRKLMKASGEGTLSSLNPPTSGSLGSTAATTTSTASNVTMATITGMQSPAIAMRSSSLTAVADSSDSCFGIDLPPPPSVQESEELREMRERARKLCRYELLYLEQAALFASCPHLVLPVSTVLLHLTPVLACLQREPGLLKLYVTGLERLNSDGYDTLAQAIRKEFVQ